MARNTRTETIRVALEGDIISGKLLPGEVLDEEALARRFKVSRTPVREAMLQLIQSGLIEKGARRSARVRTLDLFGLIQVFEAISEFEGLCARYAARRATDEELADLEKTHNEAVQYLEAGDEDNYSTYGRKFHYSIIMAAHNNFLAETTNKLALHTLPYRRFQLGRRGRMKANQDDHAEILDAMLRRDEDEAFRLMRDHVMVQGSVLAEYISMVKAQKKT